MIPRADVTHWRAVAPWPTDAQVEQDLVLSRALVELFSDPVIEGALAMRGGTALHKLFSSSPIRYSEDIDLVQRRNEPIGPVFDAIRVRLDPWLGQARSNRGEGRASLVYRFDTSTQPVQPMRLKIEINTREHFCVLGERVSPFSVESPWFSGRADVQTFELEEMLGTKLRALYQRKKGRDLFDLWHALTNHELDDDKIVECFIRYMDHSGTAVSRTQFEANLIDKMNDGGFAGDIGPLLADARGYEAGVAAQIVIARLVAKLPEAAQRPRGKTR